MEKILTRTTQSVLVWCLCPTECPLSSPDFSLSWMCTNVAGSFIFLFYSSSQGTSWCTKEDLSPWKTPKPRNINPDKCQMSLVLAPRARSPSVEKKSSISFSRSRLRFSASSRARSEFRSLISSMRCFFFSCSISCSKRSICAHRAALDSSSLRGCGTSQTESKGHWHSPLIFGYIMKCLGGTRTKLKAAHIDFT